ncbi:MAG: two-component system cell cycle response regulator [Planctomycetota bacterium]|jgi:two-component system cell cycle response regulator
MDMDDTVFEELKSSGNLPTPAGVGMKILQITSKEDYEVAEMGQAIMTDSSLTGRILQLANAGNFAAHEPATTVSESVMRLGSSSVRNLALAFSLVSDRKTGTCGAFDYELYWSTSLARAVIAQSLSAKMKIGRPEEAYICGLLAAVGRLALASVFTEEYPDIVVESLVDPSMDIKKLEQERFDIDHAQVAACMADDWGIPSILGEAIYDSQARSNIGVGEKPADTLSWVLRLSGAFAKAVAMDESASPEQWAYVGEEYRKAASALSFDEDTFLAFCDEAIKDWVEWGQSLKVGTRPQRTAAVIEQIIDQKMQKRDEAAEVQKLAAVKKTKAQTENSAVEAPKAPEPVVASVEEPPTSILLVDDEPVSLKILQMQLRGKGYDLITATSGQEALEKALIHCPDIVVADWQMPEMDGMELCRALRRSKEGRDMYFLLVTGNGENDVIVKAFDAGADDFVTKPFLPQVMSARIKGGERLVRLNRHVERDKHTMMRQVAELGVMTRKLRAIALTDALTGLPNRRYAMKRLESEWTSLKRTGRDLTLMMLDIDHFKSVNDVWGHDVGDVVLKVASAVFKDAVRDGDEVCRIGGEEFLLIAKNTSEEQSLVVAERIRAAMESHDIPVEGWDRELTVSIGIASFEPSADSFELLLKRADEALYAAKETGRNRFYRFSELKESRKAS